MCTCRPMWVYLVFPVRIPTSELSRPSIASTGLSSLRYRIMNPSVFFVVHDHSTQSIILPRWLSTLNQLSVHLPRYGFSFVWRKITRTRQRGRSMTRRERTGTSHRVARLCSCEVLASTSGHSHVHQRPIVLFIPIRYHNLHII